MEYELDCRYSTAKSFYGKAFVKTIKNKNVEDLKLYSYNTLVARIIKIGNYIFYHYLGWHSSTTTRHQKEFFKQNGLDDNEIKEIMKIKGGDVIIKN